MFVVCNPVFLVRYLRVVEIKLLIEVLTARERQTLGPRLVNELPILKMAVSLSSRGFTFIVKLGILTSLVN